MKYNFIIKIPVCIEKFTSKEDTTSKSLIAEQIEDSLINLKSSQTEANSEILDELLIRKFKKEGEYYFNVFDFFQKMHRWMYNEGLFSVDD